MNDKIVGLFGNTPDQEEAESQEMFSLSLEKVLEVSEGKTGIVAIVFDDTGASTVVLGGDLSASDCLYALEKLKSTILA
jgi:hypothetical protein